MKFAFGCIAIAVCLIGGIHVLAPHRLLPADTCAAEGGTWVRTTRGIVCAKLEIIKP